MANNDRMIFNFKDLDSLRTEREKAIKMKNSGEVTPYNLCGHIAQLDWCIAVKKLQEELHDLIAEREEFVTLRDKALAIPLEKNKNKDYWEWCKKNSSDGEYSTYEDGNKYSEPRWYFYQDPEALDGYIKDLEWEITMKQLIINNQR